jgi:hypothetical protein
MTEHLSKESKVTDKNKRAQRSKEKAKSHRKAVQHTKVKSTASEFDVLMSNMMDEQQNEPKQYFGYAEVREQSEDPFKLPEAGLICMASEVVEPLKTEDGIDFNVGQWFVSEVIEDHEHIVHGPFGDVTEALEFGTKSLNVKSYRSGV